MTIPNKPLLNITMILATWTTLALAGNARVQGGADSNWITGKFGQAVYLDGMDDHVHVDHHPALNPRDGITIALWVNAEGWSHQSTLLMKSGAYEVAKRETPNGMYFSVFLGRHRHAIGLAWDPSKFHLKSRQWYHLAVTYDAETTESHAYLNGELQASSNIRMDHPHLNDYRLASPNSPLKMGQGKKPLHGAMDDVYLYGRALTATEVRQLTHNQPVPGAIAAWDFNQGSGDVVRDITGNGFDGRLDTGLSLDDLSQFPRTVDVPVLHHSDEVTVWHQPSLYKVMKQDVPTSTQVRDDRVAASMAANEYESFQIVVRPAKDLHGVSVTLAELRSEDGLHTLSGEKIEIMNVAYIPLVKASQTRVDGAVYGEAAYSLWGEQESEAGWYPDPLPPHREKIDLEANRSHAFWITIHAPSQSPAGIYRGTVAINTENGTAIEVPVSIEVWDFELPTEFHTYNTAYFTANRATIDHDRFYAMLAKHRFSAAPLLVEPSIHFEGGQLHVDTEAFDRHAALALDHYGMNVLYMPGWGLYRMPKAATAVASSWHGVVVSEKEGELTDAFKQAFGDYLKFMTEHLRQKGWLEKTRITLVDEPWTATDFALSRDFSKLIREAAPEIDVMVTKWPMEPLEGTVDIWCLGFFQVEAMKKARARGERLEWYPNWHPIIDRPLMNSRVVGWVMWKHGITGLLNWRIDQGWGRDPEQVWRSPRLDYPDGRTIWGSGLLLYPDESFNPVSSMRWEMYRDTLEDFEYLEMLRNLCERAQAANLADQSTHEAASALLAKAIETIVPRYEAHPVDWKWEAVEWSTDEKALLQFRSEIAGYIVRLHQLLGDRPRP